MTGLLKMELKWPVFREFCPWYSSLNGSPWLLRSCIMSWGMYHVMGQFSVVVRSTDLGT